MTQTGKTMAVEIPKDLITQLQISLRKQANIPSYDPNDSSLRTLPSFPHSIPDSPHLLCIHCKAHLLRGSHSLLCIFCGKHQTNSEVPPQPIKFKSTSGYRWFLRSLNFDGSEIVGESLEGNGSNRGASEGFPLSDLLDLEIRWNDAEADKFESGLRKNNPLNLAEFDLDDDFLAERKVDSVSIPSQGTLTVKKESDSTGSNAFESRENLSLFEKFQGSKSSGSVSGWQADFQSADSRTDHNAISSQSFDHFASSSKGLSSHMDTVLGQGKDLFDQKEKGNGTSSESKSNNWFEDDTQSNSTSEVRIEKVNISSSVNLDWIEGDKAQISASNGPGKKTTDDDNDSFDDWNDFKGSTNALDAAPSSSDQTADGLKSMDEKGGYSFSGLGTGSESTVFETNHEVSKSFDHFAGSSADLSTHMDSVFGTGKDSFKGKAVDKTISSHTSDWFQDDLWSNFTSGTLHHDEQSVVNGGDKDGGMFGNLNNSSVSINRSQDDQWPTSSSKAADNATYDEADDSFGGWNDFKGLSILNSSISSWKETSIHTSSTEEKSSAPFSGWDTDFQSANSKINHEGSKSSDPFASSSIDHSDHIDTAFASGKDLVDGKKKDVSNVNSWFQDDLWSNSTSKLTCQAENFDATVDVMDSGTAQSVQNSSSMNDDWFPDDQWLTGNNKAPDRKNIDESDNSFGDWSDFKGSTTKPDAFSNSWKQAATPDTQTIDDDDDLSAAWNDFASSTSAKDSSSISFKQTVHHEKPSIETSEVRLFSVDNDSLNYNFGSLSQPVRHEKPSVETSEIHLCSMDNNSLNNFGSSSHSDFFSGAFSNQNGSTEINLVRPKTPVPDRITDANVIGGTNNAEVTKDGGDFPTATTGSKTDDLETLMSQIHDLSFMLESNLSIPPKVDG